MNKELKEQVHKEFDERFPKLFDGCDGREGYDAEVTEDVKSFLDSLIDKTILSEQERIVGIIEKLIKKRTLGNPFPTIEETVAREIISLITNKSDINNNKE